MGEIMVARPRVFEFLQACPGRNEKIDSIHSVSMNLRPGNWVVSRRSGRGDRYFPFVARPVPKNIGQCIGNIGDPFGEPFMFAGVEVDPNDHLLRTTIPH